MGGRREPGRAEHPSILGPPVAGAEVDRDPRITRGAGAQQKPAASPRSRSRSPACQIARWQTVRWQPSAARPLRGDVEAVWRANPLSGSNPGLRKQAVATLTTRPKMTTSTTKKEQVPKMTLSCDAGCGNHSNKLLHSSAADATPYATATRHASTTTGRSTRRHAARSLADDVAGPRTTTSKPGRRTRAPRRRVARASNTQASM